MIEVGDRVVVIFKGRLTGHRGTVVRVAKAEGGLTPSTRPVIIDLDNGEQRAYPASSLRVLSVVDRLGELAG